MIDPSHVHFCFQILPDFYTHTHTFLFGKITKHSFWKKNEIRLFLEMFFLSSKIVSKICKEIMVYSSELILL